VESLLVGLSAARLLAACLLVLSYAALCAYFLRPLRRRATASGAGTPGPTTACVDATARDVTASATLVVHASQTGFAEDLARRTAQALSAAGTPTRLMSLRDLDETALRAARRALFVLSTTGEGDAPDAAVSFIRRLMSSAPALPELQYAVLALGDREYRNFCAFGHAFDRWLRQAGASALFDIIEVDDGDEGALRHWQDQLRALGNDADRPDWTAPRYERWRLVERTLLNPGSAGEPCFHLVLQPQAGVTARWRAGDIAEVDPHNSTWERAAPLPHREYSIASVPEDGAMHLLVRQTRRSDGAIGSGSGWLTRQAAPGADVALRIRVNSNFHLPVDDRPLILIGNGTGIAGLRALLKARRVAGQRRNWLIFGERQRACDYLYRADIEAWHEDGTIERLDLVFSRDQPQRRYVQHRLLECVETVRAWVEQGASIYVCGSLAGMAPGVHAALTRILGAPCLDALTADGRYRRDVY